jgi:chromosome segregation ATPase
MCYHYYLLAIILYFALPTYATGTLPNTHNRSEDISKPLQRTATQNNLENADNETLNPDMKTLLKEIKTLKKTIKALEENAKKKEKEIESLATSIAYIANSFEGLTGQRNKVMDPKFIMSEPSAITPILTSAVVNIHSKLLFLENQLKSLNTMLIALHSKKPAFANKSSDK